MKIDEIENFVLKNGDNNKQAIVDELATLRAQNAELREALENAQITIHLLNHRENGKAFVGCKDCESVRAILTKYGDDNA